MKKQMEGNRSENGIFMEFYLYLASKFEKVAQEYQSPPSAKSSKQLNSIKTILIFRHISSI